VPRKHREIRSSLASKGFEVEDGRKHIFLVYVDKEGKTTTARTMLSHGSAGDDISDNLLGRMARQVCLSRGDFMRLIDCPMTREEYDEKISALQQDPFTIDTDDT